MFLFGKEMNAFHKKLKEQLTIKDAGKLKFKTKRSGKLRNNLKLKKRYLE